MTTDTLHPADLTEQEIAATIRLFDQARKDAAKAKRHADALSGIIRGYVERHGPTTDGESGLTAFLQPRQGAETMDLISLARDSYATVIELATHGCLQVDMKALKVFEGKSPIWDAAKKYITPGGETQSLQVKKRE